MLVLHVVTTTISGAGLLGLYVGKSITVHNCLVFVYVSRIIMVVVQQAYSSVKIFTISLSRTRANELSLSSVCLQIRAG